MILSKFFPDRDYRLVANANFEEVKSYIKSHNLISLDTETTGLIIREALLVGCSISVKENESFYFPVGHAYGSNINLSKVIDFLKELQSKPCVFFNAAYDLDILEKYDVYFPAYKETMALVHLNNSNDTKISLKACASKYLKINVLELKELFANIRENNFRELDPSEGYEYAAQDADITLRLYNKFLSLTEKHSFIWSIENQMVEVLRYMKKNKIKINPEILLKIKNETTIKLEKTKADIYKEIGRTINLESPKQLSDILFNEMKIGANLFKNEDFKRKYVTKTGQITTNAKAFENLARETQHPILVKIIEYRHLEKMISTYIDNIYEIAIKSPGNRVQFDLVNFRTPSGRLAGASGAEGGANIQSIPKKEKEGETNIRSAFVVDDEFCFCSIDFSAQELRIAANLSNERLWKKGFIEKRDFHTETARVTFQIPDTEEVPPHLRKIAKGVVFAILYGGSDYTIATNTGVSKDEAKKIYQDFLKGVPNFSRWMEQQKEYAHKEGISYTHFGRPRPVPEATDKVDYKRRAEGERYALNHPVQGTGADLVKICMISVKHMFDRENMHNDIKMITQVHDELDFEIRKTKIQEIIPRLIDIMSIKIKGWVPLEVKVEIGPSWGELVTFKPGKTYEEHFLPENLESKKEDDKPKFKIEPYKVTLRPDINKSLLVKFYNTLKVHNGNIPLNIYFNNELINSDIKIDGSREFRLAITPYIEF
ncbi:MAG: DNA polymerase [Candidatus Paceibacterota bacterium]|jgi:DNA polymerase-1